MVMLLLLIFIYSIIMGSITIIDTYDYKRKSYEYELMQETIQHALENNKKIEIDISAF